MMLKCVVMVVWLLGGCDGGPANRELGVTELPPAVTNTFSYVSDIADMSVIRRGARKGVSTVKEDEERETPKTVVRSCLVQNNKDHLFSSLDL